jgi:hypothetical protein
MKTASFVGGVFGLLSFLVIGLLPAIVYGGFAGVVLSASIYGPVVHPNLVQKAIVVSGMVTGTLATAGIFVVVGAALATGIGYAFNSITQKEKVHVRT